MIRLFQKWIALILAIVMALGCAEASAQTAYIKVSVDNDATAEMPPAFGMGPEQTDTAKTILQLISLLGCKATMLEDGAQVDLDVNGKDLLSLGFVTDGHEAALISTLCPSFALKLDWSSLGQIIESAAPGFPTDLIAKLISGFVTGEMSSIGRDIGVLCVLPVSALVWGFSVGRTIIKATAIGEAVTVEYETDGVKFDTMVPVTVDTRMIAAELKATADKILNNEFVTAALQSFAEKTGVAGFSTESFRSATDDFFTHFPDTVTAEYYFCSGECFALCVTGRAFSENREKADHSCTVLFRDDRTGTITFRKAEPEAEIKLDMTVSSFCAEMTANGSTRALEICWEKSETAAVIRLALYLDSVSPVICAEMTFSEGGERTLAAETKEKTAVTVGDLLDTDRLVTKELLMEISTGVFKMLPALMQEVPGIAVIISNYLTALMSGSGRTGISKTAAASEESGTSEEKGAAEKTGEIETAETETAERAKQTLQLGTSGYMIEVDASYEESKRTAEEISDGKETSMHSPDILMDIDICQFSKEGYPQDLKEFMLQRKDEFRATSWGTMHVNGIDMAWYNAVTACDGKEYETITYILDGGNEYVEIVFWPEGENTTQDADKVMQSIGFIIREGE